jgi:uncharacterized spore protein YtfJ
MEDEPSDDELREFVGSMLSNLDKLLRDPEVIGQSIRDQRETWVLLYRASLEFGSPDS